MSIEIEKIVIKIEKILIKILEADIKTHKCNTNMQCMTYEPSPSLILGVVSVVDIGEEVMNVV